MVQVRMVSLLSEVSTGCVRALVTSAWILSAELVDMVGSGAGEGSETVCEAVLATEFFFVLQVEL